MASYIQSKVRQSLSFLLVLVIAFSVFTGVLFVNPSLSYAFNNFDYRRAIAGDKYLSNLGKVDLSKADLINVNLSGANLSGANLIEAKLSGANLSRANLSQANLSGANLSRANLSKTYLSQANFNRSNLSGTNLSGAYLAGVNLSEAIADSDTKFPDGFDAVRAGVNIRK